jgi:hypothetical protein
MPSSLFFLKKNNPNEVASHHLWGGLATPTYIYIFFLAFSYFLGFFCFLRKKVMGHFGNNKVKWVKLPQFETLGGLSVTF